MGSLGPQLEFRILGPLEVVADGSPLPLGGPKQRALLAVLAINAGRVVSLDRLTEDLWGDSPPKNATTSLHVYVSHLRKVLEPERARGEAASVLASQAPGYVLSLETGGRLDLTEFERPRRAGPAGARRRRCRGRRGHPPRALGLWRGTALADFLYEPFAQSEIARLEELRLACTEDRVDADLACGRHDALVAELEVLTRAHPLRERLHGQLMLALYRAGRQAEALAVYSDTRERLVEELGIDPGPALQELNRAILNQDEALAAPSVRPPEPAPPPAAVEAPAAPTEPVPAHETRKVVTVLFAGVAETRRSRRGRSGGCRARHAQCRSGRIRRDRTSRRIGGDRRRRIGGRRLRRSARERGRRHAGAARGDRPAEGGRSLGLGATVAVHTGEAIAADGAVVATGDVRRTAQGLEHAATAGQILLTDATRRLVPSAAQVEAIEPVELRGRRPLEAWRLVELVDGAPAFERRLEAPLVGRAHELEQLDAALQRAVRERTLVLFTLLGSAGVGKSRLTGELLRSIEADTAVLVGRCLSYGEGVTFLPLREIVEQATGDRGAAGIAELLGADEEAAELLAGLVGFEETEVSADEAAEAMRVFVESLADERPPLVLVIEDIHWADTALLDLLDRLADIVHDAPVLLLCLTRPELLDTRPTWGGGKHNAVSLLLEPLTEEAAEEMIDALPGGRGLDPSVRERVARAAEGNPLFVEQMVALIVADGWAGELEVPPTIQAILAARLDRLGPAERAVIEGAAVVGREFRVEAAQELSAEALRPLVEQHLASLVRKELVRRAPSPGSRGTYRFRHSLIRDAAYRSLSKELRAELHERFADWLEQGDESAAARGRRSPCGPGLPLPGGARIGRRPRRFARRPGGRSPRARRPRRTWPRRRRRRSSPARAGGRARPARSGSSC